MFAGALSRSITGGDVVARLLPKVYIALHLHFYLLQLRTPRGILAEHVLHLLQLLVLIFQFPLQVKDLGFVGSLFRAITKLGPFDEGFG